MSGHSKWSTIKRKKGAEDAKRGKIFTRLAREIAMASREGGGDPESNFRLRLAVDKARAQNMPKDSIDRAIKRGTGEGKDGVTIEQIFYEGYAPNGVALMIDCMTENRNRTVAELRHALGRTGGTLADPGSVAWQFKRVSYFSIPAKGHEFDAIFELAVEGGADDVQEDGEYYEIVGPVEVFKTVNDLLRAKKIQPEDAELRMVPNQEMDLDINDTVQVLKAIERIEDLDDVQNVYSNLSITEEALVQLESE